MEDLQYISKYPFLEIASEYMKKNGPSLEELLNEPEYESARIWGKKRVFEAIEKDEISYKFESDVDGLRELLGYVVSRIIVSCVNDSYLTRRYALAEARRIRRHLKKEEDIDEMANELNINFEKIDDKYALRFTKYLKLAKNIRNKDWRLINQDIKDGFVKLSKDKACRLIEEALRFRFESELPIETNKTLMERFKETAEEIKLVLKERKKKFEIKETGKVDFSAFPPCMKNLVGMAQASENISHSGRFALTTFLNSVGFSKNEILKIFGTTPDFDEGKTTYQVEHITGISSGTIYSPPKCKTMLTYGLCIDKDELCASISHPMSYYKKRRKSL
ncbi:MAG: DNA primase large subunit PriL [Candidatus Thermoplasmatota archaeon]